MKVTAAFCACPCGQRGEMSNRRPNYPGQMTRDFSYEVTHDNPEREHTVRVTWNTETGSYDTERTA